MVQLYLNNPIIAKELYHISDHGFCHCYCAHPAGVHSNGICPFKVAYGDGCYAPVAHVKHEPKRSKDQMPRDHHFIGSDAVQRGARHGLNSNLPFYCIGLCGASPRKTFRTDSAVMTDVSSQFSYVSAAIWGPAI